MTCVQMCLDPEWYCLLVDFHWLPKWLIWFPSPLWSSFKRWLPSDKATVEIKTCCPPPAHNKDLIHSDPPVVWSRVEEQHSCFSCRGPVTNRVFVCDVLVNTRMVSSRSPCGRFSRRVWQCCQRGRWFWRNWVHRVQRRIDNLMSDWFVHSALNELSVRGRALSFRPSPVRSDLFIQQSAS